MALWAEKGATDERIAIIKSVHSIEPTKENTLNTALFVSLSQQTPLSDPSFAQGGFPATLGARRIVAMSGHGPSALS